MKFKGSVRFIVFVTLLHIFFVGTAFSQSKKDIIDYQNNSIDRLIYNYGLEKSLRFNIENDWSDYEKLINKSNQQIPSKTKKETAESDGSYLHFLKITFSNEEYQNTYNENQDEKKQEIDIEEILPELKSKVNFLEVKAVSDEEKKLIRERTKAILKIKSDNQVAFEIKKKEQFDQARFVSEVQENFWKSLYDFIINQTGYMYAFGLLIFLLIIYLAMKKNAEKISAGMKDIKLTPPPAPTSKPKKNNKNTSDLNIKKKAEAGNKDDDFASLDSVPASKDFVSKIENGMDKQPSVSKYHLWKNLKNPSEQMFFLNYINSSDSVDDQLKLKVKQYLIDSFGWSSQNLGDTIKPAKPEKEALLKLYSALSQVDLARPGRVEVELIDTIFPKFGGVVDKVIERFFGSQLSLLYKFFPDECLNFAEKKLLTDPQIADQIADLLYIDDSLEIDEVSAKRFCQELSEIDIRELVGGKTKSINKKVFNMLMSLSDQKISDLKLWDKMDLEAKNEFPTLDWISNKNVEAFHGFIADLTSEEAVIVEKQLPNFESLIEDMDERSKYRFKEKLNDANMDDMSWESFRIKIAEYFSNPSAENEAVENVTSREKTAA